VRKLVRDKLHFTTREGQQFSLVLGQDDYEYLLKEKLHEEYAELRTALKGNSPDRIREELVDMMEVLFQMASRFCSMDRQKILDDTARKYITKGGFETGVVLKTED
jgi:predicted house-cleaning noncanonical NTP pyrophosphatase (MazG superfamily)